MPKHSSLLEYYKAKVEGRKAYISDLLLRIEDLHDTIATGVQQYQTLRMQYGNSRNEIGVLRQKVKDLQEQLDSWEREY